MTAAGTRAGIYYWKCDRPAAFHGTGQGAARERPEIASLVRDIVARYFGRAPETLRDGGGQGNHLTFVAGVAGNEYFVRIEDGPERDDYLAVESFVMEQIRGLGVPTSRVHAVDASRREVPFAWQILEYIAHPDLNRHFKAGTLDCPKVGEQLGRLIATWQRLPVEAFGPFDADVATRERRLHGGHERYASYFFTRFDAHLAFLCDHAFLDRTRADAIRDEVLRHRSLLDLEAGCLVHKDLALWNVLGSESSVAAVIDWDDCIAGDPMDDLALLGCFHDGAFLRAAFGGYAAVRPMPPEHTRRFWLHLLRNMIFKAVIRVGAGYFNHDSKFFLIGAGGNGASLRQQTSDRITTALSALRDERSPFTL